MFLRAIGTLTVGAVKLDGDREKQLANVVHMGLGMSGGPAAQLLAGRTGIGSFASGLAVAGALFVNRVLFRP